MTWADSLAAQTGLAVTLVDYRKDQDNPTVVIPYEFSPTRIFRGHSGRIAAEKKVKLV